MLKCKIISFGVSECRWIGFRRIIYSLEWFVCYLGKDDGEY